METDISLLMTTTVDLKDKSCSVETEGVKIDLSDNLTVKPVSKSAKQCSLINTYCEKIEKVLRSKNENQSTLSIELDWGPSLAGKPSLKLKGQLLKFLLEFCDDSEIKLYVKGDFRYLRDDAGTSREPTYYSTKGMEIVMPTPSLSNRPSGPDMIQSNSKFTGQCTHANEAVCEDSNVVMSENEFRNHTSLFKSASILIVLKVDDEYHVEGGDVVQFTEMCRSIQQNEVCSDVSILSANSQDVLRANKCFLVFHSPVLKSLLEGNFQEAKTNKITMAFSFECVKALLKYVYTLDFEEARDSPKLALELFQAANYYEIKQLEEYLAKLFIHSLNSWFDISSAIELFQTANRIGISFSPKLKKKAAQVLLSKSDHQKDASFQKLFHEDWNTAMEMCAMLIKEKAKDSIKRSSAHMRKEMLKSSGSGGFHGFVLNLIDVIIPEPLPNDSAYAKVKKYCEKLSGILKGKDGNLYFELNWLPSQTKPVWLKLQGPLLHTLQQLCGKQVKLSVHGDFCYRVDYYGNTAQTEFATSKMEICMPSIVADAVVSKTEDTKDNKRPKINHDQTATLNEATCSDLDIQVSDPNFCIRFEGLENATIHVVLEVEDEYLYQENTNLGKLEKLCKIIQRESILSDVSIVTVNAEGVDSVFSANKCFLAAHSPVLRAMFEGEFKESKTNAITMAYSKRCVKALLDYVYTMDFPDAVKCSLLALELLQASNYYQIAHLEDMLVEMLLLRGISWFDVDAAIELFRFAEKIKINCSNDLKCKAFQVLKFKAVELLNSASFNKLFAEDMDTAMKLCAMALEK